MEHQGPSGEDSMALRLGMFTVTVPKKNTLSSVCLFMCGCLVGIPPKSMEWNVIWKMFHLCSILTLNVS